MISKASWQLSMSIGVNMIDGTGWAGSFGVMEGGLKLSRELGIGSIDERCSEIVVGNKSRSRRAGMEFDKTDVRIGLSKMGRSLSIKGKVERNESGISCSIASV